MSITYQNFDLRVARDGQIYATSETEGEVGPIRLQLDRNELSLALPLIEQEGANPELVREVGRQLYQALFPAPILAHFERSRAAAPDRRLRLRLRIESDELAFLPWEFLFDGETLLGLSMDTPLVRYPEVPQPIQSLQVEGPLRILVVIASPVNYPDLNRESQAEELKAIFSGLQAEGVLEVEFLLHATYAGLMRRLRTNEFHVLHYLGYSGFDTEAQRPVLLFEEENGMARKISGDELSGLLHREDLGRVTKGVRALRLVLINDCERSTGPAKNFSVGVATSLVRSGVPAALAMQYSLPDGVARKFAAEFYDAIARGLPIDAAATLGRAAIKAEIEGGDGRPARDEAVPGEWGAPVLFMHAEDGQLFQPQRVERLAFDRSTEQIYTEIDTFRVETRDRLTRFFLDHLGALILLSGVGVLVYLFATPSLDYMFPSAWAVVYGCTWLLRSLFRQKVPDTFDKLWRRRLITTRDKGNLTAQYLHFLKDYNGLLNNQRYAWSTRALGLAVAVYSVLDLNYARIASPWRLPLQLLVFILAPLAGYVLGTLLWKMIATVIATRRLSYRFDLDVRPTHPDKCGGLKPLGDLYFANAWIVLLAGLFIAVWVLILSLSYASLERHAIEDLAVGEALIDGYPALCSQYLTSGASPSTEELSAFSPATCDCLAGRVGADAAANAPRYRVLRCITVASDVQPTPLIYLAVTGLRYYRWLDLYSALLIILALVAIFTFLFPMINTHRIMRGKGPRFRRKADSLAGEIAELERYIEQYGIVSSEESTEISRRLAWLEDRYQGYNNPPMWPFDARVRFRMAGSLAGMGVSFVTSEIVPAIVGFLRSVFGGQAR
jgi:hypothetical protein